MTQSLDQVAWPAESLGEALLTLAKFAKLPHQPVRLIAPHARSVGEQADVPRSGERGYVEQWLEAAAERIGLESESVAAPYSEVESLLRSAGPALISVRWAFLPDPAGARSAGDAQECLSCLLRVMVVLGASKWHLRVVAPDLSIRNVVIADVRDAMCHDAETPHRQPVETLLTDVGLSGRERERAGQALLEKRLADERIGGCWLLRAPDRGDVRWGRGLTMMIGSHLVEQTCALGAWSLLGWMTFSGRLDGGWLLAWMLLLACVVPFRLLSLAAGGQLSLEFSSSLRRRLLAGALRLDPDRVRVEGTGGLLGRVLEADTLEQLALGGGLQSVLSVVEILLAASVLASAASQWGGAALLVAFVVLAVWMTVLNVRRREVWTDARLGLTNDLVERMVGHRTTLAQEPRDQAAAETDQSLERYLDPSTRLDRSTVVLQSVIPRAWRRLRPFLAKPDQPEPIGEPDFFASLRAGERQGVSPPSPGIAEVRATRRADAQPLAEVILDARDVMFRHANRSEPVLRGVDLTIHRDDRILLEGPSGGGKSTLAALLAGARTPQAGVLLLRGLDRQTLGRAWRRRIVLAPQFHHNHVLMGTFLCNLLLGRGWPPSPSDVEAAERLCRQLDLGPLIDRMPGGLLQMVGETGWQLSHGERSRLFLARALLQEAELVLLDETFSALDPETLSRTLPKVLDLAPTLVVIAHP